MNAASYAVMLLARQDYTEKKMREALAKKGYSPDESNAAVDFLVTNGLVSDRRYAENYVELNKEKYGVRRMEFFLKQKGISQDILDKVLGVVEDFEELGARGFARTKLCREIERGENIEDYKVRQRVLSALVRRGYSFEASKDALEREIDRINGDLDIV